MTTFKVGDKVKVVTIAEGYEDNTEYAIGDVLKVTGVHERSKGGYILDTEDKNGTFIEVYEYEVVPYEDEYEEICKSLSQAIADKAAQMEDGDIPKLSQAIQLQYGRFRNHPHADNDNVEHPSHYTQGKFETIEMIAEITQGYGDGFTAHCAGTATKYISRAPHKGKLVEDLKKARQYLDFAIEHEEKKAE